MTLLINQNCTVCAVSSINESASLNIKLGLIDIEKLLIKLNEEAGGWGLMEEQGIQKLSREFEIKRYNNAIRFANQVAELAESVNHHPLMMVEYGKVTIQWWSHNIKGLHQNDFIMASKTSALISE